MKKDTLSSTNDTKDVVGCLGEFNRKDEICLKYCSLNIRCIIELERNTQMDILDELFYAEEGLYVRLQ